MAQMQRLEVETVVKCNAENFYNMIKNNLSDLYKIFPEAFKSVEVLQGDGKNVGTVRLWKYVLPGNPIVQKTKEKIEAVDNMNKSMTLCVVDGDILNRYKSFKAKVHVTAKGNGSSVKWSLEFQKADESVPNPNVYLDMVVKINEKLDAFLLKA